MPLAAGEVFAGYRIQRLLGSGGMGEVYLAQHPRLPRLYALKVLPRDLSSDADYRARFDREADVAAALYHPHIVGVHDRGEDNGQLWISMDYVEGADAGRVLRERYPAGMPPREAFKIITATAAALDYAHDHGCLHRDVKPANILLSDTDSRILLADFGIARRTDEVGGLTATNSIVATLYYAAPEQLMGQPLDGRADQYALGITAYELLCGSLPIDDHNKMAVISRRLTEPPPSLPKSRSGLASLDPVMAIALSKEPADRFPNCADFARALTLAWGNSAAPHKQKVSATQAATLKRDRPATKAANPKPRPKSPRPITKSTRSVKHVVEVKEPRPRWPVTVSTVIMVLLLAGVAVAFVVRPWQHDEATTNGTTTTPPVAATLTFDSMRDFVIAYYADLPTHPYDAWAKIAPNGQNETGEQKFVDFWAKIQSVALISVSPRDDTSVVARLKYVRNDGGSPMEDRWLKMELVSGTVLLDASGRIGTVDEPSTTTTTTPLPTCPTPGPGDEPQYIPPCTTAETTPTTPLANAETIDQMLANTGAGERPIVSGLHDQGYGYLNYGLVSQAWDRTCSLFGGAHGASSIAVADAKNELLGMRFTPSEADAIIGIALRVHGQPGIESCP